MADRTDMALATRPMDVRTAPGLDPVLRDILIGAVDQGTPRLSDVGAIAARAYFAHICAQLNATQDGRAQTLDMVLDRPDGAIPARLYQQSDAIGDTGIILFIHGGGWVLGNLDTHDQICRHLSHATGWPVLALDYRLAPEHPFPAGLDDARFALAWLRDNADRLGADSDRIVLVGDSAGGNIAAALTLDDRACGRAGVFGQVLIYPALAHDFDTASMHRYTSGFGLTRDDMQWFHRQYRGKGGVLNDPLYAPLLADALCGLPPALVVTAGFDPLGDEGRAYAEGLRAAGSTVVSRDYAALNHGFLALAGLVPEAKIALEEILELVRSLCWRRTDQAADAFAGHQHSKAL